MAKQKPVIDSLNDAFNAKYQKNGVVYASNIATVNTRDEAGNVVYQQGQANPLLVIEAIGENITNQSVLKVVDTQFNYYKFPARTNVVFEPDFEPGIDPNEFAAILEEISQPPALPARYSPAVDQRIPETTTFTTLDFSTTVTGQPQQQANSFSVTQKVLDEVTTQIRVTGLLKTFYSANLDTELSFAVMEYDDLGALVGRVSPVITPSEGAKFDNKDRISGEGDYLSTFDFTIIKSKLILGHTYRVAGQTDRNTDKRNHTLIASESYINYVAE
jgi:hypothetical protein